MLFVTHVSFFFRARIDLFAEWNCFIFLLSGYKIVCFYFFLLWNFHKERIKNNCFSLFYCYVCRRTILLLEFFKGVTFYKCQTIKNAHTQVQFCVELYQTFFYFVWLPYEKTSIKSQLVCQFQFKVLLQIQGW